MTFWRRTYEKLFVVHRQALVAMAQRRIRDHDIAAELVQDVYLRLMLADKDLGEDGHTRMLYASVRHAVIDHHRSHASRTQALESVLPGQLWQTEAPSPQDQLEAREALSALDLALMELSPRAREMFLLHRVDGVSNAALARRYGISVSAVEKQLARVMRHCQQRLSEHQIGD